VDVQARYQASFLVTIFIIIYSNLFLFFRTKYVKKFYDIFSEDNVEHQIYIWVFLDAVLDESFKELEITLLAFPGSALCTKLIPTIAKWSPRLEKLTVSCKIRETDYSSGKCEELQSFILSIPYNI